MNRLVFLVLLLVAPSLVCHGQVTLTGVLQMPRWEGANEFFPLTGIYAFATVDDPQIQSDEFRTFEMGTPGWYTLSGSSGRYSIVFTNPAQWMRPIVKTNIFTSPGETVDPTEWPRFDYQLAWQGGWDEEASHGYYQTFLARGSGITSVGFMLVHDGIDGEGPGGQNVLVSIHEVTDATPETWRQIGPTIPVINVDCGGAKSWSRSVCWNSGEVPTEPGRKYAVYIRPEVEGRHFQTFWRDAVYQDLDCYRIAAAGETGWTGKNLWMTVGSDSDGILIPYSKRIQTEFTEFAGFARKWSQTYVAQGDSLAFAMMYAAVSGAQPPLSRQRAVVRVRRGGPRGEMIGAQKLAIGNGVHTGDASWGAFGVAYAPGEVPLVPGETYAIEFETIETFATIGDWVNIKGVRSEGVAGFNPYKRYPGDEYAEGTAYANGETPMPFDLDMQIIEYRYPAKNYERAVEEGNLLANGSMDEGEFSEAVRERGGPSGWERFAIDRGTSFWYMAGEREPADRYVKIIGGSINGQTVDGGYVQKVTGLHRSRTYRLSGQVRCSHELSMERQAFVGYDPSGQTENPLADTIVWKAMPGLHGFFVPYESEPIRPDADSISVWVRGRITNTAGVPFEADFDAFSLNQVRTEPPAGPSRP